MPRPIYYRAARNALRLIVLVLAGACWAQEADPSEPAPAGPPPADKADSAETLRQLNLRKQQLLSAALPQTQVVWLQIPEGEPVLAVYQPDSSGKPQGAVLVLHAEGQHPIWPGPLAALFKHLPEHGWAVMGVSLPDTPWPLAPPRRHAPPPPYTPETEPADDSARLQGDDLGGAPEIDPTATATPTPGGEQLAEDTAQQAIAAATQHLKALGQLNLVLIGQGLGAARALQHLAQASGSAGPGSVRALVLIDLSSPAPANHARMAHTADLPAIPILDIVFEDAGHHTLVSAQLRAEAARRHGHRTYVQRQLQPATVKRNQGEVRLIKAVRGFLNRHALGTAVEEKQDINSANP